MLQFWETAIEPALEALRPRTIVEIGSDYGKNTRNLLEFCKRSGAELHSIDPLPKFDVSSFQEEYGEAFVPHLSLSLNALPQIERMDAVLVDGDHNWYTVFNELKLLEKRCAELSQTFPLVMLHDIGWPYGRRDLYYDPDNVPQAYQQPYKKKGLSPDSRELLEEGGLNGHLYNAVYENDLRNGVLTAVEDFLKETELDLDFLKVPGFHGLGVLVPLETEQQNAALREHLDGLRAHPSVARHIETLEKERAEAMIRGKEAEVYGKKQHQALLELQEQMKNRETEYEQELEKVHLSLKYQEELLQTERARSERNEQEIERLRQSLLDREQQLSRRDDELSKKSHDAERLTSWMEQAESGVSALLGSRQWKAGRAVGELHRLIKRNPRVPMAPDYLSKVFEQFHGFKEDSKKAPGHLPEGGAAVKESQPSKPRISKEELAGRIRQRLGAVPQLELWPKVSVIILNRNGLSYLRNLFDGLQRATDYPERKLEVILVDNASTDGSVEFVRSSGLPFEVRVIENSENVSFSEGNNQGAELAGGELLLFANNDIEPFESGWLKELVALCHQQRAEDGASAGAVGARLVYPGVTEHDVPSGYTLQHRGVSFKKDAGEERHRNAGMGEDALDELLGVDEERPAITAACMLLEKSTFESVGGFTAGYRYGSEDVDLCLKLLSEGRSVISSGRAVLFHDESPSQKAEGREFMRVNRSGNRKLFWEKWGPELRRRCRLERLSGGGYWTFEGKPHVALTVTSKDQKDGYGDWHTAHEMGDALAASGWRVSYVERKGERWYDLPSDLDYLLVLIDLYDISRVPEGITTIAWVRNWTERWVSHPWFEDYDVVLASSGGSKRIIEENTAKSVDALFPIASNPKRFSPAYPEPDYEADYVFTGNFWGELRGVVDSLDVYPQETFRLFGRGWENVPRVARYAQGILPYDEMPKVYSSSKLVIDDTASPTLPYGAVNSRVFDALATGTLVITNCEAGVRELFDEDFPTYSGRESLRAELDRLLADPDRRKELASRYQRMVLEEHTYEKRARQLEEILRQRTENLSFCIKIGAPNEKEAQSWGDTHYARAMRRQLETAGHPCAIQTLDEWDSLSGMGYDVAIHLKGLTPYTTKPGQLNVLWNISHPEKLTAGECENYDLVFAASRRWADSLAQKTETPVYPLQQATDPEVFYPEYDPGHAHDLVFVGNSRKVRRRILQDLLPTKHDLAVWGKDWEGLIDKRYVVGEYLPNDQVRKAYSSAAIVLNDHWDDMRQHGFISNRVYDALACGAFIISDRIEELDEEFGEAVVTYESPEELRELVEYYLAHPEERKSRGERGRKIVLQNHTFEQRMKEISLLNEKLEGSGLALHETLQEGEVS